MLKVVCAVLAANMYWYPADVVAPILLGQCFIQDYQGNLVKRLQL